MREKRTEMNEVNEFFKREFEKINIRDKCSYILDSISADLDCNTKIHADMGHPLPFDDKEKEAALKVLGQAYFYFFGDYYWCGQRRSYFEMKMEEKRKSSFSEEEKTEAMLLMYMAFKYSQADEMAIQTRMRSMFSKENIKFLSWFCEWRERGGGSALEQRKRRVIGA